MSLIDLASLDALFRPRSVAVVGASSDPAKLGGAPVDLMKASGYQGRIYPVNPRFPEIQGLRAYPSVSAVEGDIDLAIVAVPGNLAPKTLAECAAKGVRAVVMFSSGFAELGTQGRRQQDDMAAIASAAKMRLLGPNSMGVVNFAAGMVATFQPTFASFDRSGVGIGIVSQSGAFGGITHSLSKDRRLPLSFMVTTGNEADVDVADGVAFLAQDPGTRVILLSLEGVRNGPKLIEALSLARSKRKPVVAIKLGRTDVGAKAVASHTAALTGSDDAYGALFRQYGVYRARSLEELLDIGYACNAGIVPMNRSVGLMTASGGVGVMMADEAGLLGLDVVPPSAITQEKIKALVPFAGVSNPIDITGQAFSEFSLFDRAIRVVLEDGGYESVVAFFGSVGRVPKSAELIYNTFADVCLAYPDKLVIACGLTTADLQVRLSALSALYFEDPTRAIRAVAALSWFRETSARAAEHLDALPEVSVPKQVRNEVETMSLLRQAGLPMIDERLAIDTAAAVAAAAAIGFPVALKVVSADILHKSEVGGVELNLGNATEVAAAFERIMAAVKHHLPAARIDGCLVAPMIKDGVETIIGVSRDAVFGPVVMFGLGGIFVEALRDVSFRVAPFGIEEAHRMIQEVRAHSLLEGIRGRPRTDVDALAATLSRVSVFARQYEQEIESLDLNPVVVLPQGRGVVALDAVLVPRVPG